MRNWILMGVVLAVLLSPALFVFDSEGDGTGFTVTDGDGKTYEYDGPSDHIITAGYAVSHTVQQLGAIDKIVATDYYGSAEYAMQNFGDDSLNGMNAINLGSIFSSDIVDSFEREVPKLHDQGKFDFDDTIILTTSSKAYDIREVLNSYGFTHVLIYKDVEDFETIVDMMRTISLVATGEVDDRVAEMEQVAEDVSALTADVTPAKALYVWHNSNGVSVGNTGIMSSLLELCHAEQLGLDTSIDKGYYGGELDIINLIDGNQDAVIFVNYSYFTAGNTISDFREKYLGGNTDIKVVEMGRLWNNYCFESSDALKTIAQYLYPEIFGEAAGDVDEGDSGSDYLLYGALAAVVVVIIAVVGYYYMRKP